MLSALPHPPAAAFHEGQTSMRDATHGLPIHTPDPDFGRRYLSPGEALPQVHLAPGWWLLPMLGGGLLGWAVLIRTIFF